jgi:hypothetical protein
MKVIPILIIFLPFCLIISNGFRKGNKPFWKALKIGFWLLIWLYTLLCLELIQRLPILPQFIIGLLAFILPLYLVWRTAALHWFSQYTQRAQWIFSACWTAIWYLLFDHTGLGLITWILVWPVVFIMLWRAFNVHSFQK